MTQTPKRWELWWANVKFEDKPESKPRPVLIYNDELAYILSFKITSHKPRKSYFGEYPIKMWKEAGLIEPSTIRCEKSLHLNNSDLLEKIGKLQIIDIRDVRKILSMLKFE